MLLRFFPGRMLEELDSMDILRLMRARDAQHIEDVEQAADHLRSGKIKADSLSAHELAAIERHDRLMDEFDGT